LRAWGSKKMIPMSLRPAPPLSADGARGLAD
jgi:hypothetical protein